MKLLKGLLFIVLPFTAGFLVHALIFPDVLSNGIVFIPDSTTAQNRQGNARSIFTDITFDGKRFNRTNVTLRVSDYLSITNESTEASMMLVSSEEGLSTPRPYQHTEQVRMRMDIPGTYYVEETETGAKLAVTVKKSE